MVSLFPYKNYLLLSTKGLNNLIFKFQQETCHNTLCIFIIRCAENSAKFHHTPTRETSQNVTGAARYAGATFYFIC